MGFKTSFNKMGKSSTPLKVAIAVAATRSGMTRDEDSNLPSRLRLGHGIPTIQGPRLGDVARAQIVPPRTGATRSTRGVRPGVFFTHIMKQGKSKASAEDILRRVAHAQFAKHSEGSVAVTQAETPRQPYDVQVVGTNTTTEASEEQCLTLVDVPRSPRLSLDNLTMARIMDPDHVLPNPIIEHMVQELVARPCIRLVLTSNSASMPVQPQPIVEQLEEHVTDNAATVVGSAVLPQLLMNDETAGVSDDSDLVSIIDLYFDRLPLDYRQVPATSGGLAEPEELSEEDEESESDEGVRLPNFVQDNGLQETGEAEIELQEVVPEHQEADDGETNAQNESDDDDDTSSSSHDAGRTTNSSRIPSASTAATSESVHVAAAHFRAPYIEAKGQEEIQQLTDSLQHQQSVTQDLRLQVLEREEEVETLQKVLKAVQDERKRFEVDQDNSDATIQTLKQQLVLKDREIAQEKATANAALQEVQHLQRTPLVLGDQQLIFERGQALAHVQHYANQAQQYQAIALAASEARANLEETVQQMEQTGAYLQQRFVVLEERIEQADDAISGLEQQNNHLVQLKDQAEGKVNELRSRVEALTRDITVEYVKDPTPAITNPLIIEPNELRDLQQAFEMSQQRCADLTEAYRDLNEQLQQKEAESVDLSTRVILERKNRARLFTSLEKWQEKIENWKETIPGIARDLALLETDPGLMELLESSKVHEENVRQELESLSRRNHGLEAQILDIEQQHARESKVLNKGMEEVQEENIRMDAENANLHALQDVIKELQDQVASLTGTADSWKQQCLHKKYGDTAVVIEKMMRQELDRHTHEREALYRRLCQYDSKVQLLELDLSCIRGWVADKMSGIRYLEAERDWYHAQVIALRERFASDLDSQPLDVPWDPNFSTLTSDQERQQLSLEDAIIAKVTGYDLGRADELAKAEQKAATEKCPHGITALEIWSGIATGVNVAACQGSPP